MGANWSPSAIVYSKLDLTREIADISGLDSQKCLEVIIDIASASNGTFIHFPERREFVLQPFSFSLEHTIGSRLRLLAREYPNYFSSICSRPLGDALVGAVINEFVGECDGPPRGEPES